MLMRLLLPLAVLVCWCTWLHPLQPPRAFREPDVLIIFNAMLFAVIALLVGATPVRAPNWASATQTWLRRGEVVLAALALLVGLYALAAIVYRTAIDRLTPTG